MSRRVERAKAIVAGLKKLYPDADCELKYSSPLELLVAVILSAQCTDVRVNAITKTLFKRYRTADEYADADPSELESIIKSAGFFRMKAKSIIEAARAIRDRYSGRVPDTMEDLLTLRGVARKTANVVLGNAYGISVGIVVDTHMKRLSWRMGLTDETDPVQVERDLMKVVPKKDWFFFSHGMIWHGRRVCKAQSPQCGRCLLASVCPQRGVEEADGPIST